MLGARFCVRTVSGFGTFGDPANASHSCSTPTPNSLRFPTRFGFGAKRCRRPQTIVVVYCKSSLGSGSGSVGGTSSDDDDDRHHEFLEASLLLPGPISLSLLSLFHTPAHTYTSLQIVPQIWLLFRTVRLI